MSDSDSEPSASAPAKRRRRALSVDSEPELTTRAAAAPKLPSPPKSATRWRFSNHGLTSRPTVAAPDGGIGAAVDMAYSLSFQRFPHSGVLTGEHMGILAREADALDAPTLLRAVEATRRALSVQGVTMLGGASVDLEPTVRSGGAVPVRPMTTAPTKLTRTVALQWFNQATGCDPVTGGVTRRWQDLLSMRYPALAEVQGVLLGLYALSPGNRFLAIRAAFALACQRDDKATSGYDQSLLHRVVMWVRAQVLFRFSTDLPAGDADAGADKKKKKRPAPKVALDLKAMAAAGVDRVKKASHAATFFIRNCTPGDFEALLEACGLLWEWRVPGRGERRRRDVTEVEGDVLRRTVTATYGQRLYPGLNLAVHGLTGIVTSALGSTATTITPELAKRAVTLAEADLDRELAGGRAQHMMEDATLETVPATGHSRLSAPDEARLMAGVPRKEAFGSNLRTVGKELRAWAEMSSGHKARGGVPLLSAPLAADDDLRVGATSLTTVLAKLLSRPPSVQAAPPAFGPWVATSEVPSRGVFNGNPVNKRFLEQTASAVRHMGADDASFLVGSAALAPRGWHTVVAWLGTVADASKACLVNQHGVHGVSIPPMNELHADRVTRSVVDALRARRLKLDDVTEFDTDDDVVAGAAATGPPSDGDTAAKKIVFDTRSGARVFSMYLPAIRNEDEAWHVANRFHPAHRLRMQDISITLGVENDEKSPVFSAAAQDALLTGNYVAVHKMVTAAADRTLVQFAFDDDTRRREGIYGVYTAAEKKSVLKVRRAEHAARMKAGFARAAAIEAAMARGDPIADEDADAPPPDADEAVLSGDDDDGAAEAATSRGGRPSAETEMETMAHCMLWRPKAPADVCDDHKDVDNYGVSLEFLLRLGATLRLFVAPVGRAHNAGQVLWDRRKFTAALVPPPLPVSVEAQIVTDKQNAVATAAPAATNLLRRMLACTRRDTVVTLQTVCAAFIEAGMHNVPDSIARIMHAWANDTMFRGVPGNLATARLVVTAMTGCQTWHLGTRPSQTPLPFVMRRITSKDKGVVARAQMRSAIATAIKVQRSGRKEVVAAIQDAYLAMAPLNFTGGMPSRTKDLGHAVNTTRTFLTSLRVDAGPAAFAKRGEKDPAPADLELRRIVAGEGREAVEAAAAKRVVDAETAMVDPAERKGRSNGNAVALFQEAFPFGRTSRRRPQTHPVANTLVESRVAIALQAAASKRSAALKKAVADAAEVLHAFALGPDSQDVTAVKAAMAEAREKHAAALGGLLGSFRVPAAFLESSRVLVSAVYGSCMTARKPAEGTDARELIWNSVEMAPAVPLTWGDIAVSNKCADQGVLHCVTSFKAYSDPMGLAEPVANTVCDNLLETEAVGLGTVMAELRRVVMAAAAAGDPRVRAVPAAVVMNPEPDDGVTVLRPIPSERFTAPEVRASMHEERAADLARARTFSHARASTMRPLAEDTLDDNTSTLASDRIGAGRKLIDPAVLDFTKVITEEALEKAEIALSELAIMQGVEHPDLRTFFERARSVQELWNAPVPSKIRVKHGIETPGPITIETAGFSVRAGEVGAAAIGMGVFPASAAACMTPYTPLAPATPGAATDVMRRRGCGCDRPGCLNPLHRIPLLLKASQTSAAHRTRVRAATTAIATGMLNPDANPATDSLVRLQSDQEVVELILGALPTAADALTSKERAALASMVGGTTFAHVLAGLAHQRHLIATQQSLETRAGRKPGRAPNAVLMPLKPNGRRTIDLGVVRTNKLRTEDKDGNVVWTNRPGRVVSRVLTEPVVMSFETTPDPGIGADLMQPEVAHEGMTAEEIQRMFLPPVHNAGRVGVLYTFARRMMSFVVGQLPHIAELVCGVMAGTLAGDVKETAILYAARPHTDQAEVVANLGTEGGVPFGAILDLSENHDTTMVNGMARIEILAKEVVGVFKKHNPDVDVEGAKVRARPFFTSIMGSESAAVTGPTMMRAMISDDVAVAGMLHVWDFARAFRAALEDRKFVWEPESVFNGVSLAILIGNVRDIDTEATTPAFAAATYMRRLMKAAASLQNDINARLSLDTHFGADARKQEELYAAATQQAFVAASRAKPVKPTKKTRKPAKKPAKPVTKAKPAAPKAVVMKSAVKAPIVARKKKAADGLASKPKARAAPKPKGRGRPKGKRKPKPVDSDDDALAAPTSKRVRKDAANGTNGAVDPDALALAALF